MLDIWLIVFKKKNNLKITEVTSPTFNLVNEYEIGDLIIEHYDLFRLTNEKETKNIGLFENFEEIITLVEWPEKISKKPNNRIDFFFRYENDVKNRSLTIKSSYKRIINENK